MFFLNYAWAELRLVSTRIQGMESSCQKLARTLAQSLGPNETAKQKIVLLNSLLN